jgi:cell wall-associated NlpC family hydrolase
MTAAEIIAAARACLDTPFVHQGRFPGMALDCAGLIIQVAKTLAVEHVDHAGYARLPGNGLLESALDDQPGLARVSDLQAGDVVLIKFSGAPQHLGIYTGENIIHAYQPIGKVCEHGLTEAWRSRIVRIYRFNEVAHG